jgi:hypothetical protein
MDNIYEGAYQYLLDEGYEDTDATEIVNHLYENGELDGVEVLDESAFRAIRALTKVLGGSRKGWVNMQRANKYMTGGGLSPAMKRRTAGKTLNLQNIKTPRQPVSGKSLPPATTKTGPVGGYTNPLARGPVANASAGQFSRSTRASQIIQQPSGLGKDAGAAARQRLTGVSRNPDAGIAASRRLRGGMAREANPVKVDQKVANKVKLALSPATPGPIVPATPGGKIVAPKGGPLVPTTKSGGMVKPEPIKQVDVRVFEPTKRATTAVTTKSKPAPLTVATKSKPAPTGSITRKGGVDDLAPVRQARKDAFASGADKAGPAPSGRSGRQILADLLGTPPKKGASATRSASKVPTTSTAASSKDAVVSGPLTGLPIPAKRKATGAAANPKLQFRKKPQTEIPGGMLPPGRPGGPLATTSKSTAPQSKGGALVKTGPSSITKTDVVKANVSDITKTGKGGPSVRADKSSGIQVLPGSTQRRLPAAGETTSRRSVAAATAATAAAGTAGTGVRTGTTSAIVKRKSTLADKVKKALKPVAIGAVTLGAVGTAASLLGGGGEKKDTAPSKQTTLADRTPTPTKPTPVKTQTPTPVKSQTPAPAKPAAPAKKRMTKIDRDVEELMQMRAASMDRQGRKDDAAKLRAEIQKKYAGYERD